MRERRLIQSSPSSQEGDENDRQSELHSRATHAAYSLVRDALDAAPDDTHTHQPRLLGRALSHSGTFPGLLSPANGNHVGLILSHPPSRPSSIANQYRLRRIRSERLHQQPARPDCQLYGNWDATASFHQPAHQSQRPKPTKKVHHLTAPLPLTPRAPATSRTPLRHSHVAPIQQHGEQAHIRCHAPGTTQVSQILQTAANPD